MITACAYRCPESSTIIQLRGTINYVVKTQHYKNNSCLVIKRNREEEKTLNSMHIQSVVYTKKLQFNTFWFGFADKHYISKRNIG